MVKGLAYIMAAALLCWSGTTGATTQSGRNVAANWRAADKCAKQAQAAYPDYSAEANAKRDASLKECLRLYNLTPREPLSPPSR